jgi:hypothetical protein
MAHSDFLYFHFIQLYFWPVLASPNHAHAPCRVIISGINQAGVLTCPLAKQQLLPKNLITLGTLSQTANKELPIKRTKLEGSALRRD